MRKLVCLFISVIVLILSVPTAFAGSGSVRVQIAPWDTRLDNISVYNGAAEYPFLLYKGITYIPLTAKVCARLGLMAEFDTEEGLYITSAHLPYIEAETGVFGGTATNYYGKKYSAVIPSYPIYLNGIRVNSYKEDYPFLNFRGITYLPMSWHFAVEELNLSFEFKKEQNSFTVYGRNGTNYWTNIGTLDGKIALSVQKEGYTEYTENGNNMRYPYFWFDDYIFHEKESFLEKTGTYTSWNDSITGKLQSFDKTDAPLCELLCVRGGKAFYGETELEVTTDNIIGCSGYEYDIGDGRSLILASIHYGNAPAPYTQRDDYLFFRSENGITHLDGYDPKTSFGKFYPDGKGGAYIATSAYRPAGTSGRWVTPYCTLYKISPDGTLYDMCKNYPEINSIRVVGMHDGKLYVVAHKYYQNKAVVFSEGLFSPIHSGFYCIDITDGSLTKLYSIIGHSKAFMTEDGGFYALANYATGARIINLKTGVITQAW